MTGAFLICSGISARTVEFDVRAGLNVGGTSPLPLPVEMREIRGFNPLLLPSLEGGAMFGIGDNMGVRAALRYEYKGMWTSAMVRNYSMALTGDDGNSISGYWTGCVDTEVRNAFLTVPVGAVWKVGDRFSLQAGPYASLLLKGKFSGQVYDGYLRNGTPTGDRIVFSKGTSSPYDFSACYRKFHWGVHAGADYCLGTNLLASIGLDWGLNHVFVNSFEAVSFRMFPIYGRICLGWRF